MRKIPKLATTTLLAMALCLLLQGLTPIAYAVSSESTSESSNKAVEVDFSEETQKLKLEKGKNYIISCPITGDGWLVTDVSFCIRKNVWISISDKTSSKYLSVQQISETEPGKVQLLVNCKDFNLVGFRVFLENELTGETKNYSFALTVSSPQAAINNVLVVVPDNDDDDDDSSGVPPEPSPIPPTGQPEEVPPEEEPPVNPPDEEDPPSVPTPKPIVIDTTGWSFESITAVYDGTEHTVQVTGLPDYVTPVYTNNTRTNAGSSTAHVSFIVPEGYATPADMEATITIDKAPLYVITDKNMVVNKDGKLHFSIPDGALPDGVNYSYTVNKVLADSDYTIDNTGMYLIETDFEFTDDFSEEMRQNYLTDPSTAIYNVLEHEDIEPSQYGLNFKLYLKQEESENPDEIRVTVSIKFDSSSGRNSVLTYKPVFDSSVLTYVGSELPEGMGAGVINKYGVVSAYTDSFGLLNDGPLTTFIFKVNEGADAKNLPFTITEASGVWIAPDPSVIDKSTLSLIHI